MKISRSTGYALVAVGYIAQNYKDGAVLAARVSKEYDIPLEYLLKILQQLVRANVLRSKRGPRGGFFLARPAEEITLLQIIEAVDGPMISHLHLAEQTNNAPFSIKMEEVCRNATEQVKEIFGSAKLSDLLKG
ncbi:HTH-type transcriptional regulator IscR [Anaerohalosphaera lusitana]|uniref:HTH-type transcriptional regulator IscR n=1 Tax=Anaerohalosphaera lusitana TaxID=1936003 RepID=A0A1U9NMY4_9BACT|nr:Rrf2 family transcriptional regulator [Anaerohalosphaera lusitana]AQT69312.1 HTH-type transcriptional regulator IscR [Anaerohalosphaera lusitana]